MKVTRPNNNRFGLFGSITIERLPGNNAKSVTVTLPQGVIAWTVGKPVMAETQVGVHDGVPPSSLCTNRAAASASPQVFGSR